MTLDADTAAQIVLDVASDRSLLDSPVTYGKDELAFRAQVESEWSAWRKDHPEAQLVVPPELPPAGYIA